MFAAPDGCRTGTLAKKRRDNTDEGKAPGKLLSGLLLPEQWDTPLARRSAKRQVRANELLRVIRDYGPLSRIEVARLLGFNARTVSLHIDGLLREGLLTELEHRASSRRGPRPIPLMLNRQSACVLGIDVGRTMCVATAMDLGGSILARIEQPAEFPKAPERQIRWLHAVAERLLSQPKVKGIPVAGIGLSPEGIIHAREAVPHFVEEAERLRAGLEMLLHTPVLAGSDSRLVALGERWFGGLSARPVSLAVLNVTDGLGLAVITGDSIHEGATHMAGQIGHIPLGEPGLPCFCGSHSCLENVASGQGLIRMAKKAGLVARDASATPGEIFQMAESSAKARQVIGRFAQGLAAGASVAISLHNPDVLVVSGRMARFAPAFMPEFRTALATTTPPFILSATRIEVSELHEDAVAYGTCALVLHRIFGTSQVLLRQAL